MDCNKDEAIKAKELAEKKLAELDAAGAKKFTLKAQNLYPELDGLPQLLATLDMYLSADTKINGEVDWYRVLGVQPYADEDTIRKHYRKLAFILHPDKNKSVGADGAFKILSEAWNLLSDKAKRIAYDQKRNLGGIYTNVINGKSSSSSVTTNRNGFHNFSNDNISNTSVQKGATYSKPAPPHSARNDTFWTTCNSCKMHFEYSRVYVNLNLPCINCRTPFFAVEMPAPPINGGSKYTPLSDFVKRQKFRQVHNTGRGRFSGLDSSTKISQRGAFPKSGSNINVAPRASQAAAVNHSASETLKRGHKKSQTGTMREESLPMKFHPSQKTDAGEGTGPLGSASSFAAKKHRPKKRRVDETEMGNERASRSSFQKSGFKAERMNIAGISISNSIKEPSQLEIRNILMEMTKKEISKKLNSRNPASLSNASNKPKAFNEGMDEKDEGNGKDALSMKPDVYKSMEFVDIKSRIQPKKSYTVDSDVSATKEPDPMAMNVLDPDFRDFDQDRTEKSFSGNQVWAAYDNDDGMPRYYAIIHSVISLKPFKMRMSWLNSKSNLELAPLNWIGSGFYKTSGDFWIGKHGVNRSFNSFSHKVKWSKGRKGAIQIYPRKGDVWALYRNWSSDWNELTADEVIHKYDMVEVLEDYNERKGAAVAPLVKVPGFKTVFRKHSEPSKNWMIPREELFRFSHQVPSYLLTGQEGQNAPTGCLELDPAATPLELLQVLTEAQVKEMEEINEKAQEETVSVDLKRSKEKELLENDQKMKPNISVECVGQTVMKQEIKEEKENKKPGMLVYGRRQRGQQENQGNILPPTSVITPTPSSTTTNAAHPPFPHLLQQQQQQLQMFWSYQRQEIEQVNDFKNHQLSLARIKKIMEADEDVRMISAEAPILFSKACELFFWELTIRSWLHAEENKRRTLQKNDIAATITRTDIFDFLADIVPKDEAGLGGMVGATASGVPYYYSPMGQPAGGPAGPGGMMIGRPAVDPTGCVYVQLPSQAWQSVWLTAGAEDGSFGSGGSSDQGNLDGQGYV
ncbi:hypothetical protein CRYUN_Cryun07bG0021100 [Craigia yunnanensis]